MSRKIDPRYGRILFICSNAHLPIKRNPDDYQIQIVHTVQKCWVVEFRNKYSVDDPVMPKH